MTELTSLPQWRHCESGECVRVETVRTGPCPVTYLHSCASSTWTPGTLLLNDYDPLEHSTPHPDDDDVIQAEIAAWDEAQARGRFAAFCAKLDARKWKR